MITFTKRRILIWGGLSLVVILAGAGWHISQIQARSMLDGAAAELGLLLSLRRGAVENYFDTVRAEVTFWSLNDTLITAQEELADAYTEQLPERLRELYINNNPYPFGSRSELADAEDGSRYSTAHRSFHSIAKSFVVERGYYDFFLIDRQGDIVFTVEKEDDFATNLVDGPWADTGLAEVYRLALVSGGQRTVVFSDFARYGPSDDAPALFAGVALTRPDGSISGVLAVQVPIERIQSIMQFTAGMGDTGETYLVGEDYLMRSDSRFSDVSTTLDKRVQTATVELALAGATGVQFTLDYRDIEVLSAYTRVDLDGFSWAVMAEIDRAELLSGRGRDLITLLVGELMILLLALWTFTFLGVSNLIFGSGLPIDTVLSGAIDDLVP